VTLLADPRGFYHSRASKDFHIMSKTRLQFDFSDEALKELEQLQEEENGLTNKSGIDSPITQTSSSGCLMKRLRTMRLFYWRRMAK